MDDSLAGVPAIAWTLTTSTWKRSGARFYCIMLVDSYVAVGSGEDMLSMAFVLHKFATAPDARAYALAQTARIERRGFYVHEGPVWRAVQGGTRSWLDDHLCTRSKSNGVASSARLLMENGAPLGS